MNCFPFMVPAAGCRCLLTGGGKIALHKARRLALFGVRIVVCAREILPELEELAAQVHREYDVSLLDGADFAVAATSDRAFNARVAEDCRARRVPVNCVDDRAHCDFYFPALIVHGRCVAPCRRAPEGAHRPQPPRRPRRARRVRRTAARSGGRRGVRAGMQETV